MRRKGAEKRRGFGRVERLESGRFRAAYTGPDGSLYRAPETFAAKDDAIAWLTARRAEINLELWAPEAAARATRQKEIPTLRTYADEWLESRKTQGRALVRGHEKVPTGGQVAVPSGGQN